MSELYNVQHPEARVDQSDLGVSCWRWDVQHPDDQVPVLEDFGHAFPYLDVVVLELLKFIYRG